MRERVGDKAGLGVRIGLAIVGVGRRQAALQVTVPASEADVAAERVAERELYRPPRVASLDDVQVGNPMLSGRVGLDEEPAPRPTVKLRRYVVPALGGQRLVG